MVCIVLLRLGKLLQNIWWLLFNGCFVEASFGHQRDCRKTEAT